MKTSQDIRNSYLQFFSSKGLPVIPSSSLIPHADPTLLFTSAGMVQFKANFLGIDKSLKNAVSCQKCVRTTDIDRVGFTERHLTFFEMLGNFSFGDYFKQEAISWAWEYLTVVLGIPAEKLYVSIYKGGIAPRDEEAYNAWQKYVPAKRIFELGEADNFWTMGPTGPCGPCTEIYYDFGPKGCTNADCDISCSCGRYVEIWNLVFTQFDRQEDGSLHALPSKNIDTGMGLERLVMAMQNVQNVFETDLFTPLTAQARKDLHITGKESAQETAALRILADHARSASFLIAEGILPSNEGRGYILRRLIRRGARYARLMGAQGAYLYTLVPHVQGLFNGLYPELDKNAAHIQDVMKREEETFLKTVETGEEKLADLLKHTGSTLKGAEAFYLHETYGFPLELTREIAAAKGIVVEEESYHCAKRQAQEKSRSYADELTKAQAVQMQKVENNFPPTQFTGYETLTQHSTILCALDMELNPVSSLQGNGYLVCDKTAFYAESGGQVADTGLVLQNGQQIARVLDVQKPLGKVFLHRVETTASLKKGDVITLQVDEALRRRIAANHSAIHMLNAALRAVFGNTVHQSGSFVSKERFRFDYTLSKTPSAQDLQTVFSLANTAIEKALPVHAQVRPLADADKMGAVMLLGEQYADPARFVLVGADFDHPQDKYSLELCGGTHVNNTAQIITLLALKEGSVAAGVRRIEGVAGYAAVDYLKQEHIRTEELATQLDVPAKDVFLRVNTMGEELKELKKRFAQFREKTLMGGGVAEMSFTMKNGATVVMHDAAGAEAKELRAIADNISQKYKQALVIVGADKDGKRAFVVKMVGVLENTDALQVAKQIAVELNGRAGGRADFAQGGGESKRPWKDFLEGNLLK